jgi:hypothetical protein
MPDDNKDRFVILTGSGAWERPKPFVPPNELTGLPWITEAVARLEKIRPGDVAEFTLPTDIDYVSFIVQLGLPERSHELGGVVNPKTGSVKMHRGSSGFDGDGGLNPHTKYIPPRLTPEETFEDILFHTHPWRQNDPIGYYRTPINSVRESPTDINSLLSERMIEEEAGIDRTVTSIISSRGFINVTDATGIKLDENALLASGVSDRQLLEIKRLLSLSPPEWIKHVAKTPDAVPQLMEAVTVFYKQRQSDRSITYPQMLAQLKQTLRANNLVKAGELATLIDDLKSHLPQYLQEGTLRNMGLTPEQSKGVQSMLGISQSIYQLSESGKLVKVE